MATTPPPSALIEGLRSYIANYPGGWFTLHILSGYLFPQVILPDGDASIGIKTLLVAYHDDHVGPAGVINIPIDQLDFIAYPVAFEVVPQ